MRVALLVLTLIAGCTDTEVDRHVCFADPMLAAPVCLRTITYSSNPSLLNSALITHVKLDGNKTVETTVQGGTSVGKAMVDVATAIATTGALTGIAVVK